MNRRWAVLLGIAGTLNLAEKAWNYRQTEINELKITINKQNKLLPDAFESERAMNTQLTNENLLLESKVNKLKNQLNDQSQYIKELECKNKELQNLLNISS
jgi:hypothetical protein